ncbi:MAG TPA: hydroxymethylglutaryl-CoA lyase [Ilumatobacteraceae bacterium]|nr:hydroxymethylglutaryl-CoA lyase [Ilumatobacteraceae bacterium]
MMPTTIEIVEVGPRDGLQDEPEIVSTEDKIAYIQQTVRAGIDRVEVASFANPKRVPQMADAEAVIAGLAGTTLRPIGLVLNERGLDRALATGIGEINAVVVVTDTFSRENQGMSTADATAMWKQVATRARAAGVRAGVTLSAAFGCPFEGEVPSARVLEIAKAVADAGADEISLADTIGAAVPTQTEDLVAAVAEATGVPMRVHLHNSRNTGLANAVAAIRGGAKALDASTGGIGGCPFAPGATGNIATEDLVHMLEHMGISTGANVDVLLQTVGLVERIVGHPVPGMLSKAGVFPRQM